MKYRDFNFRNKSLSDYDSMLCEFNTTTGITTLKGSTLSFTGIYNRNTNKNMISNTRYDQVFNSVFQICKANCDGISDFYTLDEVREITTWLSCNKYFDLQPIGEDFDDIVYNGIFTNINMLMLGDKIVGLELSFTTSEGYATTKLKKVALKCNGNNYATFVLDSDDYGEITPIKTTIRPLENGRLEIKNLIDVDRTIVINNCIANELILIDGVTLEITTDNEQHSKTIANDFNYFYPKLVKTYDSNTNKFSTNISCEIFFEYKGIRKVGIK